MKFTKTTVEICGKDFKYARCTNKQLLEHQKAIEHKTKKFEEFIYGTTDELINLDPSTLKGEMVVIIEGKQDNNQLNEEELIELLKKEIQNGSSLKDASKIVSKNTGVKKNILYDLALKLK